MSYNDITISSIFVSTYISDNKLTNGTAMAQPFSTPLIIVDIMAPLSSGEYTPVIGDVVSQAVTNGNAVVNTPNKSIDPSALCDDLPMSAKITNPMISTTANTGLSAGV